MKKNLVFVVAAVVAGVLASDSFALGGSGLRGRLRNKNCTVAAKPVPAPVVTKVATPVPAPVAKPAAPAKVEAKSSCANGACHAGFIRGRLRNR